MANGVIKLSVLVLAAALCVGLLGGVCLAQGDRVLVGGSPALRQSDVDKSLEALEFFFQMKFSAPERADYQQRVEEAWREGGDQVIKDVNGLAMAQGQIKSLGQAEHLAFRNQYLLALNCAAHRHCFNAGLKHARC